jgi:uncharacterized membrane protein YczE
MRRTLPRILLNLLAVTIIAIGMTLLIKANLGQSTVSGFSSTLAHILNVKAGTIVFFLNLFCFIIELIILKKNVHWSIGLQLLLNSVFGSVVNFFLYDVPWIANLNFNSYFQQLALLLTAILIMGVGVSLMLSINLAVLPYDALIALISKTYTIPFITVRIIADISFITMTLILGFLFPVPFNAVREGTIIFALTLGSVIAFLNIKWKKLLPISLRQA